MKLPLTKITHPRLLPQVEVGAVHQEGPVLQIIPPSHPHPARVEKEESNVRSAGKTKAHSHVMPPPQAPEKNGHATPTPTHPLPPVPLLDAAKAHARLPELHHAAQEPPRLGDRPPPAL